MAKIGIVACAAAAAGVLGFSATAQAQYYYPGQQRGYGYQQQGYVPPRILRKQRQMEQRIYDKYGIVTPTPRYRAPAPAYRQDPYGYGGNQRGGYGYGGNQQGGYGGPRVFQGPTRDPNDRPARQLPNGNLLYNDGSIRPPQGPN